MRWPVKKISAAGALAVAAVYLLLSGGNVATERAFVMVAVMLLAIMVDRRAFSLRAVALAALIVLLLRPEALIGPQATNCVVLDADHLRGMGSLAVSRTETGTWQIEKARDRSGARLWNDAALRQAQ